jgi:hypothetical protein
MARPIGGITRPFPDCAQTLDARQPQLFDVRQGAVHRKPHRFGIEPRPILIQIMASQAT